MINGGSSRRCSPNVVAPDGHGQTLACFRRHSMGSQNRGPLARPALCHPSPSTCWRRLRLWEDDELCLHIWRPFLRQLDTQGRPKWGGCFVDGILLPPKGRRRRRQNQAQQRHKVGGSVDGQGIALGSTLHVASLAEVTLEQLPLAAISVLRQHDGRPRHKPKRVIADRAYNKPPIAHPTAGQRDQAGLSRLQKQTQLFPPPTPRMDVLCDGTASVGRSNARLPGWRASAVLLCVTTDTRSCIKPSSASFAFRSPSGPYETTSR
jgi:hypothetical protein